MKRIIKPLILVFFLVFILVIPFLVFAGNPTTDMLKNVADDHGPYKAATTLTLSRSIGYVVSAFLSILGVIFIILVLIAGYNWMTAAGDETKVTKAKVTIRYAVIGLVIIVSSYAIWNFVLEGFLTK